MAGYSKRSLVDKLGIKAGFKIYIANAPENYGQTLGELPTPVAMVGTPAGPLDFIQFFTKQQAELEAEFPRLKEAIAQDGMLWISWPKKASKIESDLTEDIIREIGLRHGLVDVKVCAVDNDWSGLKFVYRLKDRN